MKKGMSIIYFIFFITNLPAQNIFSIRSSPDSANVFINDSLFGKTPLIISNLKNGYMKVSIEKDTLRKWWTYLNFRGDTCEPLYAILDGDYGLLSTFSTPIGGKVFLNDSLIGYTPLIECKIKTGYYNVKILKDGFVPWERSLYINPMLHKLNVSLNSLYGKVTFNNIKLNQVINVDGKLLEQQNYENHFLSIGSHYIQYFDSATKKEIFDRIEINPDLQYNVFFKYDEFSYKPVLLSAIVPGLGQIYHKSYFTGALILISFLAEGCLTATAINNYNNKLDEYNYYENKYLIARTEVDATYYHSLTQGAYDKMNTASTYKSIAISTLIGIYLYNLLDAIVFNGKFDVMLVSEKKNPYETKGDLGYNNKINVGIRWKY